MAANYVADSDRIMLNVAVDSAGCWIWLRNQNGGGYGKVWSEGRTRSAHRVAYELFIGPIPEGMHLDHLCRVRNCVNPEHLEPVTNRENLGRSLLVNSTANRVKSHCKRGHEFSVENTRYRSNGSRACRACQQLRVRRPDGRRVVSD